MGRRLNALLAHWQDALALGAVAAAAIYLVRGWILARRRKKEGAACGACAHNPENQADSPALGKKSPFVPLEDFGKK